MIATDDDPDTENRLAIIRQLIQDIDTNSSESKNYLQFRKEFAIKFATKIAKPEI